MLLLAAIAGLAAAPATAAAQASGTLAFQQEGPPDDGVNVIPSSGGTQTFLTAGEFPAISPNGQTVAYIGAVTLTGGGTLTTIPAGGGSPTQLTGASPTVAPAWSSNGSQLTYLANGDLMLVGVSGGTAKRLVNGTTKVLLGASAFVPNSSRLMFLQATGGSGVLGSYGVRTITANGTGNKAVKVTVPSGWKIAYNSLSVSSSGKTIAFTVRQGGSTFGLGVAPAAGGKATIIKGYWGGDFAPGGNQLCAQAGGLGVGALTILSTSGSVVSPVGVTGTGCSWGA